jgi:Sugar phosphate isomerases/epimerases
VKQNIIGTTTANGYPFLSLKERFKIYKKLGYRSVMLWWGENDKDTRDKRVSLAKKYNLQIENVHSDIRYVLDHYQDRHIAFCYDSGHANAWSKDVDWLSLYGDRLAAVHLHCNNGIEDQHIPPFMGTIDWVKIMERIKGSSYDGSLTLETEYRGKEDIDQLEDFHSKSYQKAADLVAL